MVSILLPATVGTVLFRQLPVALKILAILIFSLCGFELSSYVLYRYSVSNMFLHHAYTFIEFGLISAIYFVLFKSKSFRISVVVLGTVFLGLSIGSLFFIENVNDFNSFQRSCEVAILMIYFFVYIYQQMKRRELFQVEFNPYFLLTVGFLIYFSGTFLLFFYANEFIKTSNLSYWIIHCSLNIFLNIIYSIVLWKGSKLKDKRAWIS